MGYTFAHIYKCTLTSECSPLNNVYAFFISPLFQNFFLQAFSAMNNLKLGFVLIVIIQVSGVIYMLNFNKRTLHTALRIFSLVLIRRIC